MRIPRPAALSLVAVPALIALLAAPARAQTDGLVHRLDPDADRGDAARPTAEASAPGIAWRSGITVERVSGHHKKAEPLAEGGTIRFAAGSFGARGNLIFSLRVYIPGVTDDRGLARDAQHRAAASLGLRVKSPWITPGSRPLSLLQTGAGPHGNDWVLGWSLADPGALAGDLKKTGLYPFTFERGEEPIGSFDLLWVQDRVPAAEAVGPQSAVWQSGVMVRRIAGHARDDAALADGATFRFAQSDFGARRNLIYRISVYVPGLTDHHHLGRDEAARAVDALGFEVRSPWITRGRLKLGVHETRAGPFGNDYVLGWMLADSANFDGGSGPASGSYPVEIWRGDERVARFTLDWAQR